MKKTHNFGIELTKTDSEDQVLDKKNDNTLWADAIEKDMNNANIAFDIMPDEESVRNGCNKIRCHIIFDAKMEDFICKARLVADGHTTETPNCQT